VREGSITGVDEKNCVVIERWERNERGGKLQHI
jgi:hypothetical protein